MEVTGAAQIGMFDDRVLGIARTAFELVDDDGGDAFVGQCADRDRAGLTLSSREIPHGAQSVDVWMRG